LTSTETPKARLDEKSKNEKTKGPDLAKTRREIIERREGRLADRLLWKAKENRPLALKPSNEEDIEPSQTHIPVDAVDAVDAVEDIEISYTRGSEASERGDHAGAVESFTRVIRARPKDTRVLLARARARRIMGCVRDAIDDLSAALAEFQRTGVNVQSKSEDAEAYISALLARGDCFLECERYDAAACDFHQALGFRPKLASASEGLRRARQLERKAEEVAQWERERAAAAEARGDVAFSGFVKPGMARFEDRGKSGKPF
jgi:tetratricopeptide (TPR) repeat protein